MKKALSLFVALLLVLSLTSCSFLKAENTPEDVVKGYFDALKVVDMEKMDGSYYKVESSDVTPSDDDIKVFEALFSKFEYEIVSSEVNTTDATVKVSCKKADYDKATEAMTALAVENIENGVADGTEGDDYYLDLFINCIKADDAEMTTSDFDVKCIRVGNKWYLDPENDALNQFVYGDITEEAAE